MASLYVSPATAAAASGVSSLFPRPSFTPHWNGLRSENKSHARSGIVTVKDPAKGDVFQANQAMNAKPIPKLLELRQKALRGDVTATDHGVPISPELAQHCAAYELAFVYTKPDPEYANSTDGRDTALSTMSVFSCFNDIPRDQLVKGQIRCVGVCDTENSTGDIRDQGSRGLSVTVHGVRTIMLTGPQHVHPGDVLFWLPPVTSRDRNGQKVPIYQRKSMPQKLYPTVLPLSFSQSDYCFCEMWLRKSAQGHSIADKFADHPSYQNMDELVDTLAEDTVIGQLLDCIKAANKCTGAAADKVAFAQELNALALSMSSSKAFKGVVKSGITTASMFLKRDDACNTVQNARKTVFRTLVYFISNLVGAWSDFTTSHVIGMALDAAQPGDSLRILKW